MNIVAPIETTDATRHARLFELIRQKNLATGHGRVQQQPAGPAEPPQQTASEFARAARHSLLPEEQKALGISASFGR